MLFEATLHRAGILGTILANRDSLERYQLEKLHDQFNFNR